MTTSLCAFSSCASKSKFQVHVRLSEHTRTSTRRAFIRAIPLCFPHIIQTARKSVTHNQSMLSYALVEIRRLCKSAQALYMRHRQRLHTCAIDREVRTSRRFIVSWRWLSLRDSKARCRDTRETIIRTPGSLAMGKYIIRPSDAARVKRYRLRPEVIQGRIPNVLARIVGYGL